MRESFQKVIYLLSFLCLETKAELNCKIYQQSYIHTISLTKLDNNTIATLYYIICMLKLKNLIHYKLYLMKS